MLGSFPTLAHAKHSMIWIFQRKIIFKNRKQNIFAEQREKLSLACRVLIQICFLFTKRKKISRQRTKWCCRREVEEIFQKTRAERAKQTFQRICLPFHGAFKQLLEKLDALASEEKSFPIKNRGLYISFELLEFLNGIAKRAPKAAFCHEISLFKLFFHSFWFIGPQQHVNTLIHTTCKRSQILWLHFPQL